MNENKTKFKRQDLEDLFFVIKKTLTMYRDKTIDTANTLQQVRSDDEIEFAKVTIGCYHEGIENILDGLIDIIMEEQSKGDGTVNERNNKT
jgi:hypothetical protein